MLPDKPWKLESLLRLLVGIFACVFIGSLLALLVRGAGAASQPPSVWRVLVGVVCFQGATVFLVWRFVREHEMTCAIAFGVRNGPKQALVFGAVFAALFLPIAHALQGLSGLFMLRFEFNPVSQQSVRAIGNATAWHEIAAFAFATIVLAPLAEELLFRGVLYPAVKRAGFPRLALWGTSALFALIHFNLATALPLFAFALLLATLYEKSGNLAAPFATHSLFNAANLAALYLQPEFQRQLFPHT